MAKKSAALFAAEILLIILMVHLSWQSAQPTPLDQLNQASFTQLLEAGKLTPSPFAADLSASTDSVFLELTFREDQRIDYRLNNHSAESIETGSLYWFELLYQGQWLDVPTDAVFSDTPYQFTLPASPVSPGEALAFTTFPCRWRFDEVETYRFVVTYFTGNSRPYEKHIAVLYFTSDELPYG